MAAFLSRWIRGFCSSTNLQNKFSIYIGTANWFQAYSYLRFCIVQGLAPLTVSIFTVVVMQTLTGWFGIPSNSIKAEPHERDLASDETSDSRESVVSDEDFCRVARFLDF